MASGSVIKSGFGEVSTITLPFTASRDCVVNALIQSSTVSGANSYIYFRRNSSLFAAFNGSASGGRYSLVIPLKANDTLSLYNDSNIASVVYTVFPLS